MSNETVFAEGWHVTTGDIPGDVVIDDTQTLSGGTSVYFPSTASTSAVVVSDWIPIDDLVPTGNVACSPQYYFCNAHCRADSIASGKNVWVGLEVADEGLTTVTSRYIWNTAPLPVVNSWEPVGGMTYLLGAADSRFIRFNITRPTDIDFDLWVDSVSLQPCPPMHRSRALSGGTFTTAWATVTGLTKYTGTQISDSSGVVSIEQPGAYVITGAIQIHDDVADGDIFHMRLKYRRDSNSAYLYTGQSLFVSAGYLTSAAGEDIHLSCSTSYIFNNNTSAYVAGGGPWTPGTIELQVAQSAGTLVDYVDAQLTVLRVLG